MENEQEKMCASFRWGDMTNLPEGREEERCFQGCGWGVGGSDGIREGESSSGK